MTSRHFRAFAEEISQIHDAACRAAAAKAVACVCRRFNPNFDQSKFYSACGVEL